MAGLLLHLGASIESAHGARFRIVLKEPYGLLLDALAKTSTPLCVMMKAEIAASRRHPSRSRPVAR